ncbi:hypothetical protein BST25_18095 [Mycobacterium heidelbergense]|uniref:Uncharacterized protein n=1 Tax=Mycobacterium heidelbergense TaxID=53376 RepID=A0A1X0DGA9_MYCHE|nr:hypothetical protein BST25_18095 [Mycobacterium heidelbergense]
MPPVCTTGAPTPAAGAAGAPWSKTAGSAPPAMVGADTDGTIGACGGGAAPTAFNAPSDNLCAPAAAG